jgi:hypothetical protein
MNPARVLRCAIVLKPSTLLDLHRMLAQRKYRLWFSSECRRPPGPKGANRELIDAVVEMKRRNPNWVCPRIAQQITCASSHVLINLGACRGPGKAITFRRRIAPHNNSVLVRSRRVGFLLNHGCTLRIRTGANPASKGGRTTDGSQVR